LRGWVGAYLVTMSAENQPSHKGTQQGVVAVVQRGRRFLMIRRAAGVLAGGSWCFVGGAIGPGESQQEAVVREFAEEVGGRARARRKIWEYRRPDGKLRLHWWLVELEDSALQPNPLDVAEVRGCTSDEIEALPRVLKSNLRFIAEVGRALAEGAPKRAGVL
jgi:8-oxo-dGTP diphosphatase